MKLLLVYLPFCTPASPPYSLTYLYSFLKANSKHQVEILDLNLKFHQIKFPHYQEYYQQKKGNLENSKNPKNWNDYEQTTKEYNELTAKTYSENNKKVVHGEKPELFSELLEEIRSKKADLIAFSLVYSSQAFYAYSMLEEINRLKKVEKMKVKTILGGPALNERIKPLADKVLNNEIEFLEFIEEKKLDCTGLNLQFPLDFTVYDLKSYFTPHPVLPLKTSSTCYYQQCTFCAHYSKGKYLEYPLEPLRKTIINSKQKYFFLIDDMLPAKRLLQLAEIFKPLNIKWACQLKPTKDFTLQVLETLHSAGLALIIWGVESGSQRVLDLMKKGTHQEEMVNVLSNSHLAGIKNIVYIMFGFPTETKEEFLETIELLKSNQENIDLISTSIFGLQSGTPIYQHPEQFGIGKIITEKRRILDPKITYEVESGLSQEQAATLRKRYKKTIENINKYPKTMNFFKEHLLCLN